MLWTIEISRLLTLPEPVEPDQRRLQRCLPTMLSLTCTRFRSVVDQSRFASQDIYYLFTRPGNTRNNPIYIEELDTDFDGYIWGLDSDDDHIRLYGSDSELMSTDDDDYESMSTDDDN